METTGARTIRVGLIGTGQIGTRHIDKYSQMPDVEIVAVCDIDEPKMQRVAENTASPICIPIFASCWRGTISKLWISACTTTCTLRQRSPRWKLEKTCTAKSQWRVPSWTPKRCSRPRSAWAAGLSIQLNTLFDKEVRAAKELIAAGTVGKIYHARSAGFRRRGRPFVDGYGSINFVQKDISAGGALYDMGEYISPERCI